MFRNKIIEFHALCKILINIDLLKKKGNVKVIIKKLYQQLSLLSELSKKILN